jgi:uncharacterized protein (DUF885 family)
MRSAPPTVNPDGPVVLHPDAVAGIEDPALAQLLHDSWEHTMREAPVWASMLGDDRYANQLGDNSDEGITRRRAATADFLNRAQELNSQEMSDSDELSLTLFIHSLQQNQAEEVCQEHTWSLSARRNPVVAYNSLPQELDHDTLAGRASLHARYRQIPVVIHNEIEHLRRGIAEGRVVTLESASRVIEITEAQLAQPSREWPLLAPLLSEPDGDPVEDFEAVVDGPIRRAFEDYLQFLQEELAPVARNGKNIGMSGMPGGAECYQARIRRFTSLELSADEIHQIGLQELDRIHAELRVLGEEVLGSSETSEIAHTLRTDPTLRFETSQEVQQAAEIALQRATDAMSEWFGRLPEADCVVVPIPDYEAPFTTIAYYRQATESKPGEYYINTYAPETRPRFEAEVLAWHEAIPGHHLQIAIARELEALPSFRRYMESTPFVEGWALYTERLADEMGLYSSDLDRIGMLSFDLWRASRLVVDTGIHAKGWSREQAIQFMLDQTVLAPNNIDNEVDRYISWPGQALGYKLGQLEMWRLRRLAEAELGDAFDIQDFHDRVLSGGALPLSVLEQQVLDWIGSQKESP